MSIQHWGLCVWEIWEEEWGLEGLLGGEKAVEDNFICFMGAQRSLTCHPFYAKFQPESQACFQEMKIVWSYLRGMTGGCFSGPGAVKRRLPSRQPALGQWSICRHFPSGLTLVLVSFSG